MIKPENFVSVTCTHCKEEFYIWPSTLKWTAAKYCSRECYYARGDEPDRKESRFWTKVEKSDGCWLWTASTQGYGYGKFGQRGGESSYAHRYSYELAYGPIADGMKILHRCDTPRCVRPDHLFLGTQADNSADMIAKDRHARGERNGVAKLTEDDIREIRRRKPTGIKAVREVAAEFGVCQGRIYAILQGSAWKHVGE